MSESICGVSHSKAAFYFNRSALGVESFLLSAATNVFSTLVKNKGVNTKV